MTLKKIKDFSETREAGAIAQAIQARHDGGSQFYAVANDLREAPAVKARSILA
jgi:hypothetical protein